MRKIAVFFALVMLGMGLFASAEDGLIDIDDITTQATVVGEASPSGGSDGDDEDGSSILSDEGSGESGSGVSTTVLTPEATTAQYATAQSTTADNVVVDVHVRKIKEKQTTTAPESTKPPEKTPSEERTTEGTTERTTKEQEQPSKVASVDPNGGDDVNAAARSDPQEKVLRVLTTEVIAAVVVGAVCAVILIAFLVYRLRKRDEGSYPLSDSCYKDTYKLRGDTSKEAFV